MNDKEIVQAFADLFDGNRTAIGLEEGGCERLHDPLDWINHVWMHLDAGADRAMGVYPLVYWPEPDGTHDWWVKWGCVDFDDGEEISYGHARNVQALLARFGVRAWIERSRSKGWHAWVFLTEWTPAWVVRRALLMACTLVGAPIREINPKSEGFNDPSALGNYIRVPYPGSLGDDVAGGPDGGRGVLEHASPEEGQRSNRPDSRAADERSGHGGARQADSGLRRWDPLEKSSQEREPKLGLAGAGAEASSSTHASPVPVPWESQAGEDRVPARRAVYDPSRGSLSLECFLAEALAARTDPSRLKALADAYKPPAAVVRREVKEIDDSAVAAALGRCRGLTSLFIDEGPRDRGRSEWLFILGHQLWKDGMHTFDECVALLQHADARHGEKFTNRRDAERRYAEIIEKAMAE